MQSPQDRRLKPLTAVGENNQQQQPLKCPRCDSVNTKFCYYNNYSLSQPRYFCKSCRRYWTQGGTLRNVPVGGGCRKGKSLNSKVSPSGENPRSSQPKTPVQPQQQAQQQTVISCSLASSPSGVSSVGSLYPGGGFLSTLAAVQSMNQQQQQQPFGGVLQIWVFCRDMVSLLRLGNKYNSTSRFSKHSYLHYYIKKTILGIKVSSTIVTQQSLKQLYGVSATTTTSVATLAPARPQVQVL